jgi:hypothetical protein
MKYIIKILFFIALIFYANFTFCQSQLDLATNEMKYWRLRGRLIGDDNNRDVYEGFLRIGPNAGMSMPAARKIPLVTNNTWWSYKQLLADQYGNIGGGCFLQYNNTIDGNQNLIDPRDGMPYKGVAEWGDATIDLGNYMAVLASEWKLLHNAGASTAEVEKELYYALNAVDRLDYLAETYYGLNGDLNGFISRDDVPEDFALNNLGKKIDLVTSGFSCPISFDNPVNVNYIANDCDKNMAGGTNVDLTKIRRNVMSVDQIVGLLVGYSLITKLVSPNAMYNNEYLIYKAKQQAFRIVSYVRKGGLTNWWHIVDPDMKKSVCQGTYGLFFSYAMGETARRITDVNCQNLVSLTIGKSIWNNIIQYYRLFPTGNITVTINFPPLIATSLGVPSVSTTLFSTLPYSTNMVLKLATLSRKCRHPVTDISGSNFIANLSSSTNREIYDAMYSLLHGTQPHKSSFYWNTEFSKMLCKGSCVQVDNPTEFNDCQNYALNSATIGAPWYFQNRWSSTSLNQINDLNVNQNDVNFRVYHYNGLDYMLAHNLYRLKYFAGTGYNNRIRRKTYGTLPFFDGNAMVGNSQYPYIHKAVFSIETNTTVVSSIGNLHFEAGSDVKLLPGFKSVPGSVFSAKIKEYDCTPVVYNNGSIGMYKDSNAYSEFIFDDSVLQENILLENDTLEDETDTLYNNLDSLCFTYVMHGDTLVVQYNPDCLFTEDGQIIYAPQGNKAALQPATIKSVNLYPNPTNGLCYLEYMLYYNADIRIRVYNQLGQYFSGITNQEYYSQEKGTQKITLNTSSLAPGIYYCEFSIDGLRETKKFTVVK